MKVGGRTVCGQTARAEHPLSGAMPEPVTLSDVTSRLASPPVPGWFTSCQFWPAAGAAG
jgi:hypothetical protein